jgi:lipoprotein-anchoring transpeptidase ErfK/SrfK
MGLFRILSTAAAVILVTTSAPAEPALSLAAADPAGSVENVGPSSPAPATAVAAAPIEAGTEALNGHRSSDAALPEAIAAVTPDEVEEAKPLAPPKPTLFADIDLASQRMTVSDASGVLGSWKISSARGGYRTPAGTYTVHWTSRMHYSRQYDWSPMPYSVFFHEGYAVHGTNAIGNLGRPASHGCVRVHPRDAKTFYNLVHRHGEKLTKIVVRGTPPYSPAVAERPRRRYQQPTFSPFAFFGNTPPSYQAPKRRPKRQQQYGGGFSTW